MRIQKGEFVKNLSKREGNFEYTIISIIWMLMSAGISAVCMTLQEESCMVDLNGCVCERSFRYIFKLPKYIANLCFVVVLEYTKTLFTIHN